MSETPLSGKVAVITGGSRGIGRAVVQKLSGLGAMVVFSYLSDRKSADALAGEIAEKGGTALPVRADMARPEDVSTLFNKAVSRYGRLDILVNNAGIAIYKKMEDFSQEEIERIFDVNIKGVFYCCRQAAKLMENNGSIINIGSSVTKMMLPGYGAYAASKGAVEQFTRVLARELGGRGIRVNTISPGPVDTDLFRRGKSADQIDQMASAAAFGRIGTVEDIADMISLLIDERSRWVTGQNIPVNGGIAA